MVLTMYFKEPLSMREGHILNETFCALSLGEHFVNHIQIEYPQTQPITAAARKVASKTSSASPPTRVTYDK